MLRSAAQTIFDGAFTHFFCEVISDHTVFTEILCISSAKRCSVRITSGTPYTLISGPQSVISVHFADLKCQFMIVGACPHRLCGIHGCRYGIFDLICFVTSYDSQRSVKLQILRHIDRADCSTVGKTDNSCHLIQCQLIQCIFPDRIIIIFSV